MKSYMDRLREASKERLVSMIEKQNSEIFIMQEDLARMKRALEEKTAKKKPVPSNQPFELPKADPKTAKYAIFEGIKEHNRFFSMNRPETDQTKICDGTVAYVVLGYANTVAEAQMFLNGYVSTDSED